MNVQQNLWLLIHRLRPEEVEVCRKYLTAFDRRGGKFENKGLKLFEILLENRTGGATEEMLSNAVYGSLKVAAIQKLQTRLKAKILEMLHMDINIEREEVYPKRVQVLFSLRKQLNYAQILQVRSMTAMVLNTYDDIIQEGVKYELWEEVITASRLKCGLVAISQGENQYERCARQWKEFRQIYRACILAESKYNELVLITNYRTWTMSDTVVLRENIVTLTELFNKTNSSTVEFHLRRLEAHYHQIHFEYEKAGQCLQRVAVLTKTQLSVATRSRHSGALLNIVQNSIYKRDFTNAISTANEGLKYLTTSHSTSLYFLEFKFYGYFYLGQYHKALSCIEKATDNAENFGWSFQKGKWLYLKACCEFALGNYQEVDSILLHVNPIENDKNGWNLGVRFLLIINNIEREKFDMANARLDTIRKLSKPKEQKNISPRNKLIIRLIRALDRKSYRFNELTVGQIRLLTSLENSESEYRWEILSPELIIFSSWLRCKIDNVPFQQIVSMGYVRPDIITLAI